MKDLFDAINDSSVEYHNLTPEKVNIHWRNLIAVTPGVTRLEALAATMLNVGNMELLTEEEYSQLQALAHQAFTAYQARNNASPTLKNLHSTIIKTALPI